jgi:hypothetical protein
LVFLPECIAVSLVDESWAHIAGHVASIVTEHIRANPPIATPWLDPEDAAAYLRLTVRGLEDMRGKGTGPRFHKVGSRVVRYHRDDLDAWLLSDGGARG